MSDPFRPVEPRCGYCRFWDGVQDICRRHAPRANTELVAVWPITDSDDWCGEFQLDPECA